MLRRGGPIALLVGLGLVFGAAPAHAGVYSVYACHLPNGTAVAATGWLDHLIPGDRGFVNGYDGCRAAPGVMTLEHYPPGGPSATYTWSNGSAMVWTFGAPADTTIAAVSLERSFSSSGANDIVWEVSDGGRTRERCVFAGGGCSGALAGSVRFTPWTERTFAMSQTCRAAVDTECSGPVTATYVSRAIVELRDDSAPLPSAPPSGPLVDGTRPLAGRAEATLSLRDTGGGIASVAAEVDGRVVATTGDDNGGRCRAPYSIPVPCKLAATATVGVDTSRLVDGPHRVRLIARDAAGNSAVQGPYDVSVRNTPVACAPGINGAITAGLPRKQSASQKRAKAARISGTAPAGAELRLISRVSRRGDGSKPVGAPVRAGADGRYSLRVPKGPSRSLRVGWRRAGEPDFACSRTLSLRVRARVSLSGPRAIPAALPRARFRGRLTGGYVPRRGKLVLLQGRQPGRNWRTFRAVRTNRKGRFSTRYRFSGAPGRFRVRARVPSEAVYPFGPASSRVVRVAVR